MISIPVKNNCPSGEKGKISSIIFYLSFKFLLGFVYIPTSYQLRTILSFYYHRIFHFFGSLLAIPVDSHRLGYTVLLFGEYL